MQKKKLTQQQMTNPVKTAEQLQFESQWKAGTPSTTTQEESHRPADPTPPASSRDLGQNPEPDMAEDMDFSEDVNEDCFEDASYNFQRPSRPQLAYAPLDISFNRNFIPGLDLPPIEPPRPPKPQEENIELDADEEEDTVSYSPPTEPPPLPKFTPKVKRIVKDISEYLDEPGRSSRPEK